MIQLGLEIEPDTAVLEPRVLHGDCRHVLAIFDPASVDAVVTDPPYELGFMGKRWDSSGIAFSVELWREVLRVLKPGGHLLAFSGTRTYHRMVCAIEDAGFEIRDQLAWMYGQGMPKGEDVGRGIDMHLCTLPGRHCDKNLPKGAKARPGDHLCPPHPLGDEHRHENIALKPAQEPIVLARKPLIGTVAANVLVHGTGGLNVDGCRIEGVKGVPASPCRTDSDKYGAGSSITSGDSNGSDPNVGRWPANVLLDKDAAAMLDAQSGISKSSAASGVQRHGRSGGIMGAVGALRDGRPEGHSDSGGASRFFYVAKASRSEREAGLDHLPKTSMGRANDHPTVKPLMLMRYLVRLITPPGGTVLDPFAGSGTTLCAAALEGFPSIGIEAEGQYLPIIGGRVGHALQNAVIR